MKKIPISHAIIVFIIWAFFTFVYRFVFEPSLGEISLEELVSKGLVIGILLAALTCLIYVYARKAQQRVGLNTIGNYKAWILIYPILVIVVLFVGTILSGVYSDSSNYIYPLINTFFVGISEELMFRGILFSAFLYRFGYVKSIVIVSLLFGGVHVYNGFITGDFGMAALQSLMAAFSGLMFMAIRVRTKSIITCIIIHWIWDYLIFTSGKGDLESFVLIASSIAVLSPILFGILGLIQLSKRKAKEEFLATQGL